MAKTVAGFVFIILAIVLVNAYREGGTFAVRSWFAAKLVNKPAPRPQIARRGRKRAG
jgi:hypothetical protein